MDQIRRSKQLRSATCHHHRPYSAVFIRSILKPKNLRVAHPRLIHVSRVWNNRTVKWLDKSISVILRIGNAHRTQAVFRLSTSVIGIKRYHSCFLRRILIKKSRYVFLINHAASRPDRSVVIRQDRRLKLTPRNKIAAHGMPPRFLIILHRISGINRPVALKIQMVFPRCSIINQPVRIIQRKTVGRKMQNRPVRIGI